MLLAPLLLPVSFSDVGGHSPSEQRLQGDAGVLAPDPSLSRVFEVFHNYLLLIFSSESA